MLTAIFQRKKAEKFMQTAVNLSHSASKGEVPGAMSNPINHGTHRMVTHLFLVALTVLPESLVASLRLSSS